MPTHTQMEASDLDLIVAGTRDAITMIEGFAREMSEDNMVQAILFGHEQIVKFIDTDRRAAPQGGPGAEGPARRLRRKSGL